MWSPALLPILAAGAVVADASVTFVPASGARAHGTAMVRLLSAQVVPMSADSRLAAPQRRTTIRLADGEHDAFIVEFE